MIKFGPSGKSADFYDKGYKSTIQVPKWCKELGLELYEYSFGRGVNMKSETAEIIGEKFIQYNIELSSHAPYYINFANFDDNLVQKSIMYIIQSIEKTLLMNGKRVVFHTASQGKMNRDEAMSAVKDNIKKLMDALLEKGYKNFILCPETMGKIGQIGTLDEVIEVCNMADYFYPCIDFGHINAREKGILKTAKDYQNIITKLSDNLPSHKVKNMHIHFSKIQYGLKGEIKHLTFEDKIYGPEFEPLAEVIYKNALFPHILSEAAGTQAKEALEMKNIYNKLLTK